MYYVFNFGSLEIENEKLYISSIISNIIKEENLKKATKEIISECHQFLRGIFEPSVVSLRELARFKKIYNFFIEYYKNKNKCINKEENDESEKSNSNLNKEGNEESEKLKSIIISI